MNDALRAHLLQSIEELRVGVTEGESAEGSSVLANFLPVPDYRRVLEPENFLVLGGRGSGKTALFRLLGIARGREALTSYLGDRYMKLYEKSSWIEGYGSYQTRSNVYPLPEKRQLLTSESDSMLTWRSFWIVLIVGELLHREEFAEFPFDQHLSEELKRLLAERLEEFHLWIESAKEQFMTLNKLLDEMDRWLLTQDRWLFISYDELDLVVSYDQLAAPIRELLAFWLDRFKRWKRIRPKIFLRSDLFRAEFLGFSDASKLTAYRVQLEWKAHWLYQVLVKRLANHDERMKDYLDQVKGLLVEKDPLLGWIPSTQECHYEQLMEMMIGRFMGANPRRGKTYTWIPNHLQDTEGRIVPRSFIKIFTLAAQRALERNQSLTDEKLLTPQDLQGALMQTSEDRIQELAHEEYRWLVPLKECMDDVYLPATRETMIKRIGQAKWTSAHRPPDQDPDILIDYMKTLGIFDIREDGRINVPEIYLHGFGMKRRGGIKRPK